MSYMRCATEPRTYRPVLLMAAPARPVEDRLVLGRLALNQETEVRPLLPELHRDHACLQGKLMRSHLTVG